MVAAALHECEFINYAHWNARGLADMGTFASGEAKLCGQSTVPATCLVVLWPFGWSVYQQRAYGKPLVWYGSIIDQKRSGPDSPDIAPSLAFTLTSKPW